MSHFTVLVIGKNPEKQLAPFHEFECTGKNDEYVREIDKTNETRESYDTQTMTRYRDKEGNHYLPYGKEFYRDPTEEEKEKIGIGTGCHCGLSYSSRDWKDGKGYRAKIHFRPEHLEEVEVPYRDLMAFRDFLEEHEDKRCVLHGEKPDIEGDHKYGYALLDMKGEVVKVVRRTNPDRKWDWFQLGGRWTGFFKLKQGKLGVLGEAGAFDNEAEGGCADQAIKGHIDFEGMKSKAEERARAKYLRLAELFGGEIPRLQYTWKDLTHGEFSGLTIDERRDLYNKQESIEKKNALRERSAELSTEQRKLLWEELEDFQYTEDEYAQKARKQAVLTFAVIKDGLWYERGSMGWWGCVSDEKDGDIWGEQYSRLLDEIPDDTLLSVYDCHI